MFLAYYKYGFGIVEYWFIQFTKKTHMPGKPSFSDDEVKRVVREWIKIEKSRKSRMGLVKYAKNTET